MLAVGEKVKLTKKVKPLKASQKVTWKSSNKKKASVSSTGLVKAKKPGCCYITAKTKNNKKASCTIVVRKAPSKVILNTYSINLKLGRTAKLYASLKSGEFASEIKSSVADSTICKYKNGTVTPKKAGTTTITFKTFNGKTAKCKINVFNNPNYISLEKTDLEMKVGDSEKLNYSLGPSPTDEKLKWTISDENVVSLSDDGFGSKTITAVGKGNAKITVETENNYKAECEVNVYIPAQSVSLNKEEIKIAKGATDKLIPTVNPEDARTDYEWISSNPECVEVDQHGNIKALKDGVATVGVKTYDNIQRYCTVRVFDISLTKETDKLMEGEHSYLYYRFNHSGKLEWSSSDPSVATVDDNGEVTAIGKGKAIVSITHIESGASASCEITVNRYAKVKNALEDSIDNAAIDEHGNLYRWGSNYHGQIGNGEISESTLTTVYKPYKVMGDIKKVAINGYCTAAITNNNQLYMWGYSRYIPYGDSHFDDTLTPKKVMNDVKDISFGENFVVIVKTNGDVYTWGSTDYGQLGYNTDEYIVYEPTKIMEGVISVSAGDHHCLALNENGEVYSWGNNSRGMLGISDNSIEYSDEPIKVMDNVKTVEAYSLNSSAITNDNKLYTWGNNKLGTLGTSSDFDHCAYSPEYVMDNVSAIDIASGRMSALTNDGKLYCWGVIDNIFYTSREKVGISYSPKLFFTDIKNLFDGYVTKNDDIPLRLSTENGKEGLVLKNIELYEE